MHDIAVSAAALARIADAGGGEMRDIFGGRVLGANAACVDFRRLAGFGESVIARIKVLPLFEVFRKVVRLRGELAVQTEEALLIRRE